MMKNLSATFLGLVVLLMSGCVKESPRAMRVRIAPVITRVTGVHFDRDDRIGLTIVRNSMPFVENAMMTYDGSVFTGSALVWYNNLNEKSTLTAYYPYAEQGRPAEFSVAADQRVGNASSDLLVAVKTDVTPVSSAVGMRFHHLLSEITIIVTNTSQGRIESVSLGGFVPTAEVDYVNLKTVAKSDVAAADVTAFEVTPDVSYRVVMIPQQGMLSLTVCTDDGKSHSKTIEAARLEGGKRYDVTMSVTDVDIDVALSGDIQDWTDGGTLGEDNSGGGSESGEKLNYLGEEYRTQKIGGKLWMAENIRHIPDGMAIGQGIWYPSRNDAACSDPVYVKQCGLLYNYATVVEGAVVKSDQATVVRGICPPGWHVPSSLELNMLVGNEYEHAAFFSWAGLWMGDGERYQSGNLNYLASTSCEGELVSCLKVALGAEPFIASTNLRNGISLRCVQDDK